MPQLVGMCLITAATSCKLVLFIGLSSSIDWKVGPLPWKVIGRQRGPVEFMLIQAD